MSYFCIKNGHYYRILDIFGAKMCANCHHLAELGY